MGLSVSEIRERLKSPTQSQTIKKAIRHENRIRFHVESFMEPSEIAQPLTNFLDWVKTLIPKDKYNIFVSLFQFPTPVIQLTNTIFNDLERVFDGKNPFANYQFTDSTYRDDWEWYRQEKLNEPEVWRKKGWDAVKTAINSVLVVDLPEVQEGEYPEPYFYFLNVENIIDFKLSEDKMEWIMFKQGPNRIAVFDDTFYRTIILDKDGNIDGEIIEAEHGLGYCPAKFFWNSPLTQNLEAVKKSPISPQLANLDWLLFFSISKKHLDLYAPYPIYSAYEADCDFANNQTGDYCDGGYLRDQNHNYKVLRDGTVFQCPVCSSKRLAGVGSFIEVPVPGPNDPDLRNPVQITTIDKDSLQYNVDEVKRLRTEIFTSVVGQGGDVQAKQSINEMQVEANFENKISVLNALKGNLEAARIFVDDTCCQLRYGDNFLGSSISMGTEFYIYSVDDLYAQYKQAKENGANESILDSIHDQIIETEYRSDAQEMQRMLILKHLEPYRHFSFEEIMKLADKDLLDPIQLQIKINFSSFVDRFERENTNIIEFASQVEFDTKITAITNKFIDYVKEQTRSTSGGKKATEGPNNKEGSGSKDPGDDSSGE